VAPSGQVRAPRNRPRAARVRERPPSDPEAVQGPAARQSALERRVAPSGPVRAPKNRPRAARVRERLPSDPEAVQGPAARQSVRERRVAPTGLVRAPQNRPQGVPVPVRPSSDPEAVQGPGARQSFQPTDLVRLASPGDPVTGDLENGQEQGASPRGPATERVGRDPAQQDPIS
jgi:hypothetical protein